MNSVLKIASICARSAQITPATTSLWPARYFVAVWHNKSTPSACGCWYKVKNNFVVDGSNNIFLIAPDRIPLSGPCRSNQNVFGLSRKINRYWGEWHFQTVQYFFHPQKWFQCHNPGNTSLQQIIGPAIDFPQITWRRFYPKDEKSRDWILLHRSKKSGKSSVPRERQFFYDDLSVAGLFPLARWLRRPFLMAQRNSSTAPERRNYVSFWTMGGECVEALTVAILASTFSIYDRSISATTK